MVDSSSNRNASSADDTKAKGKSGQAIEEFLQAPKKKRKSYVILAVGPGMDPDVTVAILRFLKTQYSKLSIVSARNADDVLRYAARNIVLTIMDDEFLKRQDTLRLVKSLKESKNDGPMPTLFLTKDPAALVEAYQKELLPWHEVDEYVEFDDTPRHAIFRKIKSGIETQYRRRAKRFKVDMPVHFQVLDTGDVKYEGKILDFSIHGALISTSNGVHQFSTKDQIIVHLPFSKYVKGDTDILRISARVRRVLISGDQAGISWEYLSDEKVAAMTKMLFAIVDAALIKSASATRAKIAKNQPPEMNQVK
jgi:hypothetical protein